MDARSRSATSPASGIRTPRRRPSTQRGLRIQSFGSPQSRSPQSPSPAPSSDLAAQKLGLISPFERKLRIISGTPSHPTPLRQVATPAHSTTLVGNHPLPTVLPPLQRAMPLSEDPFIAEPADADRPVAYQLTPPPSSPLSTYSGSLRKDLLLSAGSKTPVYTGGGWYVAVNPSRLSH
jgi:hypothetical protein